MLHRQLVRIVEQRDFLLRLVLETEQRLARLAREGAALPLKNG